MTAKLTTWIALAWVGSLATFAFVIAARDVGVAECPSRGTLAGRVGMLFYGAFVVLYTFFLFFPAFYWIRIAEFAKVSCYLSPSG